MRVFVLALLSLPLIAGPGTIRVESGQLAGSPGTDQGITAYKGIPYAAPPVTNLRWRPPQPPAKWEGVRQATSFSPTCTQTPYAEGSPFRSAAEPVSEDCLYLNVWTGAKSATERRPVMFWIHGGALTRGAGSVAAYDGEALAKKAVVVVTINYRLGVFGFLAHPELTAESAQHSSGNYGLLDQIAALEWVKRNIGAFGGDPQRVTIFGESAGSWSVNALVASPLAKGLFQRAIGESGALFAPLPKLVQAEKAGADLAQQAGAKNIAELRAMPPADLMTALGDRAQANVDGWVLPDQIRSIFAGGKQNDVPVLIGSNADEGTAFIPPGVTVDALKQLARFRYGALADEFLKIYPAATDQEARASAAAAIRDQTFGWEMRTWARLQTKTGKSKAFVYYFSRVPPGPAGTRLGAYHASEIRYVFDNVRSPLPADLKLADTMSSYWVNFAVTGDPNRDGLPTWPPYSAEEDRVMGFGNTIEPMDLPHKPALDLLDTFMNRAH